MNSAPSALPQTNAYAMQYGTLLGLWGIVSLVVLGASLSVPLLSSLSTLLFLGSPVCAGWLTVRFRREVSTAEEGFTFGRAFLFNFVQSIYASLLIALFVFVYLQCLDGGYIWSAYERMFAIPENKLLLEQSGLLDQTGGSVAHFIEALQRIPAAQYAGMVIYMTLLSSPLFSALIALITKRRPRLMTGR